ncbi:MAG: hypothetical protein M3Y72_06925 [Acidobacteriota bacterium]|nr:hypothetical protein [Acidobacteriota bacterium]
MINLLGPLPCPAQQPPPPPPPRGPHPPPNPPRIDDPKIIERRITEIKLRLERDTQDSAEARELAAFTARYLSQAQLALRSGHNFAAERFAAAADDCRRPLEHLGQPDEQPFPLAAEAFRDHLRRVYFRLRLGAFFLDQIPQPKPTRILDLARSFYSAALQLSEKQRLSPADRYLKSADDLTHALEHLAQASSNVATPPAPPPPPR